MICERKINTLDDLNILLLEQTYNSEIDRYRSSYLYRGMPDSSFDMSTSLDRNCKGHSVELEKPLLENFVKYVSIEDPSISDSVWKAMIVGQHHGLPTRLLDWSHSTLVSLNFACTETSLSDLDKRDGVVWRIDAKELSKNLPASYTDKLAENQTFMFSVKSLTEVVNSIEQYDIDMSSDSLVCLEPPSIDQRIVNQYSFFTVMPREIHNFEEYLNLNTQNTVKYVINKNIRWQIRDVLDQMNMNERTIYPGIDGIAKWLARHYFVK